MLRRITRVQTLFSGDALAWPTLTADEIIKWENDNTLVDDNVTDMAAEPITPADLLGPVVLGPRECFLDIVFAGRWTATDANSLQGNGGLAVWATGRLRGSSLAAETNSPFAHPVGEAGNTLEDTFEKGGFIRSGLLTHGSAQINATQYPIGDGGPGALNECQLNTWPFTGNARVAGEQWQFVFPVGRRLGAVATMVGQLGNYTPEVSGYEKIWVIARYKNPASMTNGAMAAANYRIYAVIGEPLGY